LAAFSAKRGADLGLGAVNCRTYERWGAPGEASEVAGNREVAVGYCQGDGCFFSSVNLGIHGQPWADNGPSAQSPEPPARAATLPLALPVR